MAKAKGFKEWDHFAYRVAECYASALINGDASGLDDAEAKEFAAWEHSCADAAIRQGFTVGHWTIDDDALSFVHDSVTEKLADCVSAKLMVYKNRPSFFVEMTDTFGGEANYCWVHRFRVAAKSERGAMIRVARETGYSGRIRKEWDSGDTSRHNVRGAAICYFVSAWDDDAHGNYLNVKEMF